MADTELTKEEWIRRFRDHFNRQMNCTDAEYPGCAEACYEALEELGFATPEQAADEEIENMEPF